MKIIRIAVCALLFSIRAFSADTASASASLQRVIEGAQASQSDSLIILRNDQLLVKEFFGSFDRTRNIQSVTKSIVGLAIAKLMDEGKIGSLDEKMHHWIPEWTMDSQKSEITLRMILNHTSGFPESAPWWSEPIDRILKALEIPLENKPGTKFRYSNLAPSLIQRVIAKSSGMSVSEFIQLKIFNPLDIPEASWTRDAMENELTSGGLYLNSESLLKIGLLVLNQGNYKGQQIIAPLALEPFTTRSQNFADYGLLWWVKPQKNIIFAKGWGGQWIVIQTAKRIVAVRTHDPLQIDLPLSEQQYFRNFPDLISQLEVDDP